MEVHVKLKYHLYIETKRLFLIPMTLQFVSKIMNNDISAYDDFGIKYNPEWPNQDTKDILPTIYEKISSNLIRDGFGTWIFIDKESKFIIGDGGFKEAPNEKGEIDLGYGVIDSKRKQGYTYEAVTALLNWAFAQSNVNVITADCLKTNIASLSLLKKLGMQEIKQDNEMIYFMIKI